MNKTEHLLTCLIEECAEVQKAAAKALRFGLDDHHPDLPALTNADEIAHEFVDMLAIIEMLRDENIIPALKLEQTTQAKKDKVLKYMAYAKERGTLSEI
jgi:NTP pyrophosphatase (non-canonical NTP hydrolase)